MRKAQFFIFVILLGTLCIASSAPAQSGYGVAEERVATSSSAADVSIVKVYGPAPLTDLARQAIMEKQPDVKVETYYKPLKNKVYIEGTTGSSYMSLSPQRVHRMEAARSKGKSVYAALCAQQRKVVQNTTGVENKWVRVERKQVRTTRTVRVVAAPPPPIIVPAVSVGYFAGPPYPYYGYRAWWGPRYYGYYGGWRGHRYYHGYHGYRGGYRTSHASWHH